MKQDLSVRLTLANHGAGSAIVASFSPCFTHVLATTTCLLGEGDGQGLLASSTATDLCVTESLPGVWEEIKKKLGVHQL